MKLTGDLKKKVDQVQTKEEAKEAIKKAGELLTDDELEQVSGGEGHFSPRGAYRLYLYECECGNTFESDNPFLGNCKICGNRVYGYKSWRDKEPLW